MTITPEQLRIAPSVDLCRELLTHEPEQRKVSDMLTVSFKGRDFDVRNIPQIMVGEKLSIAINPWMPDAAMVVDVDSEGNETLTAVPVVERDDAGYHAFVTALAAAIAASISCGLEPSLILSLR